MYVEKAYSTVDSDSSDVKPGGPLGAFREEQTMSRHRLSPSSHTTITLHKQLYLQSPQPQLSPLHYTDTHPTRNVVCPSDA